MIIEDLELILHVLETGSFSEAGKRINMTQSGVSKRVAKVEEIFGVTLFERLSRSGVRPSSSLLKMESNIRELVENYEQLFENIKERKKEIKLSSSTGFRKDILLKLLEKTNKENYYFSLSIEDSETIINRITNNIIDCGFTGFPVRQKNIKCEKVYEQKIVLAGLKELGSIDLEDLYDLPIILHQKGSGLRRFVLDKLAKLGINIDKLYTPINVGYEEFCKQAALKGLGYTFLPQEDIEPPLKIVWSHEELIRGFWIISKNEEIVKKIMNILSKIIRGD